MRVNIQRGAITARELRFYYSKSREFINILITILDRCIIGGRCGAGGRSVNSSRGCYDDVKLTLTPARKAHLSYDWSHDLSQWCIRLSANRATRKQYITTTLAAPARRLWPLQSPSAITSATYWSPALMPGERQTGVQEGDVFLVWR